MNGVATAIPREGDVWPLPAHADPKFWFRGTTPHQRRCLGLYMRQVHVEFGATSSLCVPIALDEKLVKKLGENTFRVLDALLTRRDAGMLTHVSLGGIARATGAPKAETNGFPQRKLAERTIRTALERLAEIGLIQNEGWTHKYVQCVDSKCPTPSEWGGEANLHFHKIFLRSIRAQVESSPSTPSGFVLHVTHATAKWLREKEQRMHGGKRAGAGRPKGAKDAAPRHGWNDPNLALPLEQAADAFPTAPVTGLIRPKAGRGAPRTSEKAAPDNQDRRAIKSIEDLSSRTSYSKKDADAPKAGASEPVVLSEEQVPTSAPAAPPARKPSPWVAGENEGGISWGGGSGGTAGLIAYRADSGLPQFPSATVLEPARVPPPPLLDPRVGDIVWVQQLVDAHVSQLERRFGPSSVSWALRRRDIQRASGFSQLVACARLLAEQRISPIAWARWSFDVWEEFSTKDGKPLKPPAVQWVLSPKRVAERHGWFHSDEGGSYVEIIYSKSHLELAGRWKRMQRALGRGVPPAQAKEDAFPGDLYAELVRNARIETAAKQAEINGKVAAGTWEWR